MEDQSKKKFLMKVGIISIMALILIFWVLNIKNVFRDNALAGAEQDTAQWQKLKSNFSETVSEMTKNLDKIKETDAVLKTASSSLLEELIKETNKIATTSDMIATSSGEVATATPELEKNACPPYVNCMPTIGGTNSCSIPPSCEGITQAVY